MEVIANNSYKEKKANEYNSILYILSIESLSSCCRI